MLTFFEGLLSCEIYLFAESSGMDITPVISSLVQLMLDPASRTLHGFQCLIQREWIVAGHPFLDRLGHLLQPTKKSKQTKGVNMEGETTHLVKTNLQMETLKN